MKTASAPELILLLALLLCLPGSAAMALPPAPPGMEQAETRVVLIEEKAPGAHIIYVNERPFRVLPEAPILDRNGEPARLEGLPVPCKARITVTLYGDNRHPCVTNIVCLD
ncbi:MAG: hypothetical protein K9M82_09540 [Deltaproteobacteria bacterium]|nr:hypothetical protein [Deltaproteobacteria bacterium]